MELRENWVRGKKPSEIFTPLAFELFRAQKVKKEERKVAMLVYVKEAGRKRKLEELVFRARHRFLMFGRLTRLSYAAGKD